MSQREKIEVGIFEQVSTLIRKYNPFSFEWEDSLTAEIFAVVEPSVSCFQCNKTLPDKGAAKQWCSNECQDKWEDERESPCACNNEGPCKMHGDMWGMTTSLQPVSGMVEALKEIHHQSTQTGEDARDMWDIADKALSLYRDGEQPNTGDCGGECHSGCVEVDGKTPCELTHPPKGEE